VPCKTNADCDDLTKPQCSPEGQCVGCTDSDACDGRDGTEVCQVTAGPTRGHCVACVAHSDCPNADAPQCKSDNTCGDCTQEAACSFREGTKRCNVRTGADSFGTCVECTGATEDDDCEDKSCKQSTGECTDTVQGTRNPCQPCEADSECGNGTKCVPQTIDEVVLGYFCFYDRATQGGGCADTISALKPYSQLLSNTVSIDGQDAADYCTPLKSCKAITDAIANVDCETGGVFDDTACGLASHIEGQCLQVGAAMGTCSYGCSQAYECTQNKPNCTSNMCSP